MTKDCSLIYQFNTWKLQAQNKGRTCCAHKLFFVFVLTFRTIYAHNMFSPCSELVVFMYWTGKSMNNILSYCGLVDPRISASDTYLPVPYTFQGLNSYVSGMSIRSWRILNIELFSAALKNGSYLWHSKSNQDLIIL